MTTKAITMKTDTFRSDSQLAVAVRLFAAILAGMVFSWWAANDVEGATWVPVQEEQETTQDEGKQDSDAAETHSQTDDHAGDDHSADDHAGEAGHADGEHDDHGHDKTNEEYFLGKDHLIGHTQDQEYFEIPSLKFRADDYDNKRIYIPWISPWTNEEPLMAQPEGKAGEFVGPITFQPTKFIILQLLAGLIVGGTFIWLGKKIQTGQPPTGKLWNMLEAVVVYVRDDVAKAAIGSHDYKKFVPLIWTVFFFVLTMNLMGMFPLLGTPTANISVTSALALSIFAVVLVTGMRKLGVFGFWKAQAPHMDLSGPMKLPMTFGIWCIEIFGLFIKHLVLAVRLFANMFAGHLVLAVLVGFIGAYWGTTLGWVVAPAAVGGSVALSLLELLVAFIQAYVFAFLSALFIGAAIHPH